MCRQNFLVQGGHCNTKPNLHFTFGRGQFKWDGTCAETRFRLSAKWTIPFKSLRASVQSTTGSRGVRINGSNGSNAGYTMFRGSEKGTGYQLHSPVSPSITLPCFTVCHHIATAVYLLFLRPGCSSLYSGVMCHVFHQSV